jgi:hypothetical protein
MEKLSAEYWSNRYQKSEIGWDLRQVSPPLKEYIDQLDDKSISILIPGCGSGYEGEYLFRQGFTNVHLLDFSKEPLEAFQKRVPGFPNSHLHVCDFFKHQGQYDLILEQTLYCAIDPSLRGEYAKKTAELLKEEGKLVGLLFNREFEGGPPFGGSKKKYEVCFGPFYSTLKMEVCYNSITPRKDTELFIQLQK